MFSVFGFKNKWVGKAKGTNYLKPQTKRMNSLIYRLKIFTLKQSIISFTGTRKRLTLRHKFSNEKA